MTDKVSQTATPAVVHWSLGGNSAFATLTVSRSDLSIIYFNASGMYITNTDKRYDVEMAYIYRKRCVPIYNN